MCTSQRKVSDPTVPREPSPHPLQAKCTSLGGGAAESTKVCPFVPPLRSMACIPGTCPGVKGHRLPFLSQIPVVLMTFF